MAQKNVAVQAGGHVEFVTAIAVTVLSADPCGMWQLGGEPGLLGRLAPYEDGDDAYVILSLWPLVGYDGVFRGEPTGTPQSSTTIRYGQMSDDQRYPLEVRGLITLSRWESLKKRYQRWGFHPEHAAPLRIVATFARSDDDVLLAERAEALLVECQEKQRSPWKPAIAWRTLFVQPREQKPEMITAQLAIALLQDGLAFGLDDQLKSWLLDFLIRHRFCDDAAHANETLAAVLGGIPVVRRKKGAPPRVPDPALHRFVGSGHWLAFQVYLRTTARGIQLDEAKELRKGERPKRLLSDEPTIFNPEWIAQESGVSTKTVRRWMKSHGHVTTKDGRQGLTAQGYQEFSMHRKLKDNRHGIVEFLTAGLGKPNGAAERWIQRQLAKGLTYQDMARNLADKKLP